MIENLKKEPDIKISIKQTFGIDTDLEVDAFSEKNELVPEIDKDYIFDRDTTLAILSGFSRNKRLLYMATTELERVLILLKLPQD